MGMSDNTEANKAAAELLGYICVHGAADGRASGCKEGIRGIFFIDIFDESKGDCLRAVKALGDMHDLSIVPADYATTNYCILDRKNGHSSEAYDTFELATAAALIAVKESNT